jgi:hypothetical protein
MEYLEELRDELRTVLQEQAQCVADSGYVHSADRYRYVRLAEDARMLRERINALEYAQSLKPLNK